MRFKTIFCLFLAFTAACRQGSHSDIQAKQTANQIKKAFLHAWQGYESFAWGYDELQPLSKTGNNRYANSLYMTPVDALDTMILMGLEKEAEKTEQLIIENLSFDHDMSVQVSEINVSVLGGLLSAFQMTGNNHFLKLAEDLAIRLLPAFRSFTGMPYRFVNLKTGAVHGKISNPAEIGTMILEFGVLSKLTGKPVYFDKTKKALLAVYDRRSDLDLVGSAIDVETGEWTRTTSHISAAIDSYYEYVLKGYLFFDDPDLEAIWRHHIAAIHAHLADEHDGELWYKHIDMNTGHEIAPHFGALDAFFPAGLALSGDLDRAQKLQDSCFKMWLLHGLEPKRLNYRAMQVVEPEYHLYSEIMESAYVLYHYTQNPVYQRMAKTMFDSVVHYCKTDAGFAALSSVVTKEKENRLPSRFLAESCKYLYLCFASPEILDFDNVIFNTKAHPLTRSW